MIGFVYQYKFKFLETLFQQMKNSDDHQLFILDFTCYFH